MTAAAAADVRARQRPDSAAGPALITLTDFVTGEVRDSVSARLARWEDQGAARRLLGPDHRVASCLRRPVPTRGDEDRGVAVYRRESGATYYGGLMVCGNVWACPCCASKVSERRRAELELAIAAHRAAGGDVLLLTLTVPHARDDQAVGLVDGLCEALRRLWGGATGARLRRDLGLVGTVRALEVTHGQHGWHPHGHVLLFVSGVDRLKLSGRLFERWAWAVKAVGLGVAAQGAFSLQDGEMAARYAGKWGLAEEVTKAAVKQARSGGRTPFALLRDYRGGDKQAGALFREFVQAFKGRSQLRWSPGLRERLGLATAKSDELVAADKLDALDQLLGRIAHRDWSFIVRDGLRGVVLEVLRVGEWRALEQLLRAARGEVYVEGPHGLASNQGLGPRVPGTGTGAARGYPAVGHPRQPDGAMRGPTGCDEPDVYGGGGPGRAAVRLGGFRGCAD
jgi:hypothetical protein